MIVKYPYIQLPHPSIGLLALPGHTTSKRKAAPARPTGSEIQEEPRKLAGELFLSAHRSNSSLRTERRSELSSNSWIIGRKVLNSILLSDLFDNSKVKSCF
jgi:hypothetical protein